MSDLILPYKTRFNPELPEEAIKNWKEPAEVKKTNEKYSDPSEPGIYVFPDPIISLGDQTFSIQGNCVKVNETGVLDCLIKADCLSEDEFGSFNSRNITFSQDFYVHKYEQTARKVFDFVDIDKFVNEIENGYAFLKSKSNSNDIFEDYQNRNYIVNLNRIEQEYLLKMLSSYTNKNLRHLTMREILDLNSGSFNKKLREFPIQSHEFILKIDENKRQHISSGNIFYTSLIEPVISFDSPSDSSKYDTVCLTTK